MVFVGPCPLVHVFCPHCQVRLLVSKTITLKFTENICCVDIVWRNENQNKTNEEHRRCKQFRDNVDTLCYKLFWMFVECLWMTVTRAFCKIFLFNSILFIFECDRGPMRGKVTSHTLKILRETRFVKPIPIYDTFIILLKRCRWQHVVTDNLFIVLISQNLGPT